MPVDWDVATTEKDLWSIARTHDRGAHRTLAEPERRLMLALLTDAIVCFRRLVVSALREERSLLKETERWFRSDDRVWPGSFVNVCEAIGIAPQPLRRAILRSKGAPTASEARTTRRSLLGGIGRRPDVPRGTRTPRQKPPRSPRILRRKRHHSTVR